MTQNGREIDAALDAVLTVFEDFVDFAQGLPVDFIDADEENEAEEVVRQARNTIAKARMLFSE